MLISPHSMHASINSPFVILRGGSLDSEAKDLREGFLSTILLHSGWFKEGRSGFFFSFHVGTEKAGGGGASTENRPKLRTAGLMNEIYILRRTMFKPQSFLVSLIHFHVEQPEIKAKDGGVGSV